MCPSFMRNKHRYVLNSLLAGAKETERARERKREISIQHPQLWRLNIHRFIFPLFKYFSTLLELQTQRLCYSVNALYYSN